MSRPAARTAVSHSIGGDAVTIDRREFMAAAAAGLGSQLVSRSGDALAQTAARPLPPDNGLFPSFEARWVHTNGADIFLRHGGTGQPLLLLHGNPQSHVCWQKVAGEAPGEVTSLFKS